MSEYVAGFPKGELARQIALQGLSQKEFAAKAGITTNTLLKAIRRQSLRSVTWGKIVIALGAIPAPEASDKVAV